MKTFIEQKKSSSAKKGHYVEEGRREVSGMVKVKK